jgi:hypothetical protein
MVIVQWPRHLAMKDASARRILRDRDKLSKHNELTNMNIVMLGLVKGYCTVQDVKDHMTFVSRAFAYDHLNLYYDTSFYKGSTPRPGAADDAVLARLLEKAPGMKTPKPEIGYGIDLDAYAQNNFNCAYKHIAYQLPDIACPFLTFEWKGPKANF